MASASVIGAHPGTPILSQLWAGGPVIPDLLSCWPESDLAGVCIGSLQQPGPLW